MIGIYRIRNIINNKCYYGSAKNIEKRWERHKNDLNKNKHHSLILQRAWNKYKESNFIFEIVEECKFNILLKTEQKYLDLNPEYNIGKSASGGDNLTNNPNRNLIIEKITNSLKNRYSKLSKEEIDNIFSRKGDTNYNWKGVISVKYCSCVNKMANNAKTCIKCRDQNGEKNPFFGKTHTDKVLKYLSTTNKGKYYHHSNKEIIIDNIEYESYTDADIKLGISWATIRWRCLSRNPKYSNYNIKEVEKIPYTKEELKYNHGHSKIGKIVTSNNKPFFIDNIEYRTLGEANEKLGIHKMTIKGRLLSNRIEFKNYRYK